MEQIVGNLTVSTEALSSYKKYDLADASLSVKFCRNYGGSHKHAQA